LSRGPDLRFVVFPGALLGKSSLGVFFFVEVVVVWGVCVMTRAAFAGVLLLDIPPIRSTFPIFRK